MVLFGLHDARDNFLVLGIGNEMQKTRGSF